MKTALLPADARTPESPRLHHSPRPGFSNEGSPGDIKGTEKNFLAFLERAYLRTKGICLYFPWKALLQYRVLLICP